MYKLVAVLNPQFEFPTLANAVGHAMVGLALTIPKDKLAMRSFKDASRSGLGDLTDHPLIILKAKRQSHLERLLSDSQRDLQIEVVVFLDQHRRNDPREQQRRIGEAKTSASNIVCVALFGEAVRIGTLTKRCTLF